MDGSGDRMATFLARFADDRDTHISFLFSFADGDGAVPYRAATGGLH